MDDSGPAFTQKYFEDLVKRSNVFSLRALEECVTHAHYMWQLRKGQVAKVEECLRNSDYLEFLCNQQNGWKNEVELYRKIVEIRKKNKCR